MKLQDVLADCMEAPAIRDADCSTRCVHCRLLQDLSKASRDLVAGQARYLCVECDAPILWIEARLDAPSGGHVMGRHLVCNPSEVTIDAGGFAPILLPASPAALEHA